MRNALVGLVITAFAALPACAPPNYDAKIKKLEKRIEQLEESQENKECPQGPKGKKGDKGEIGPEGKVGPMGPQGEMGMIGLTGETGMQGPIGPQGVPGPQGVTGVMGPQGYKGEKGDIGLTGPQGIQGVIGLTGPAGIQGPQGLVGKTGLQGKQGIQGEQGLTGKQGEMGLQGPPGLDGKTGLQGPKGDQGIAGIVGKTGPQGEKGLVGKMGPQGPKGDKGDSFQGPKGDTGPMGPSFIVYDSKGKVVGPLMREASKNAVVVWNKDMKKFIGYDLETGNVLTPGGGSNDYGVNPYTPSIRMHNLFFEGDSCTGKAFTFNNTKNPYTLFYMKLSGVDTFYEWKRDINKVPVGTKSKSLATFHVAGAKTECKKNTPYVVLGDGLGPFMYYIDKVDVPNQSGPLTIKVE